MIAEFRSNVPLLGGAVLASMGPRSVDRGIQVMHGVFCSYQALQWGRDQLIAEFKIQRTC